MSPNVTGSRLGRVLPAAASGAAGEPVDSSRNVLPTRPSVLIDATESARKSGFRSRRISSRRRNLRGPGGTSIPVIVPAFMPETQTGAPLSSPASFENSV